uniref:Uncharacterized protein n=1 Tax=Anopheles arabiensis TaxID=7173 RepID=A0A182HNI3_ANOAR
MWVSGEGSTCGIYQKSIR